MPPENFTCTQCGNCCLNLTGAFCASAAGEDIKLWEKAGRADILEWVVSLPFGGKFIHDIWFNPKTGGEVERCPWLRKLPKSDKYVCRIPGVKSGLCREYQNQEGMLRKPAAMDSIDRDNDVLY